MHKQETIIENNKEKKKEEERLNNQNEQTNCLTEHVENLVSSGEIPQELADWVLQKTQEFIENNPDLPPDEMNKLFAQKGDLSLKESDKLYKDMKLNERILAHLLQVRYANNGNNDNITANQGLFYDIDTNEEFGIANSLSNSLYHLTELLKNMEVSNLYDTLYEAKGSVKNSKGKAISLVYTFQAHTEEEAIVLLKNYQSIMVAKGLKIWIAHWIMANKLGRVEYSCPMVDIMEVIANEERRSYFSIKEKNEHWAYTKMLGMSKILREERVKKRGSKTAIVQWIEQPLVEIIGGEKEIEDIDHPMSISVRVLMPKMDKKGFSPIIYKNNTTALKPSDLLLAFILQTRAGQMQRGSKHLHYNWDFIFEAGNLQTTALTNQRGAKAKARKKMDRLQESQVIEKWDEEFMGVRITPKKNKKRRKPHS